MMPSEASATIEHLFTRVDRLDDPEGALKALIIAKQAIDILATLENDLNMNEPVQIENHELEWRVTRGHRTHLGSDATDALGQMCATLALERALDRDTG